MTNGNEVIPGTASVQHSIASSDAPIGVGSHGRTIPDPFFAQQLREHTDRVIDKLAADFHLDNTYRELYLSLTANENYPSRLVRLLGGALQGSFYEFSPPCKAEASEWFFPDSGAMRALASKLSELGRRLFAAGAFDWRPNGGSAAEQAVLLGTCKRGDAFVHFARHDGGHFATEALATVAGIEIHHVPVDDRTLLVDVTRLRSLVAAHPEIKLVLLDQSCKLRWQRIDEIRAALPSSVFLAYDASHDGALIVGGAFPQPTLLGADAVHGNTHKTIPGPQKAYIAYRDAGNERLRDISDWVCPRLQSNSHAELIAPMLTVFSELEVFGVPYARQIIANAKALAAGLAAEGISVSGSAFGFTETHQVHVVIGSAEAALRMASDVLPQAGVRANSIEIPGMIGRYGLRLGAQALTRRGMRESEMRAVAGFLAQAMTGRRSLSTIRCEIAELLVDFPLRDLAFSFDTCSHASTRQRLLREVLGPESSRDYQAIAGRYGVEAGSALS